MILRRTRYTAATLTLAFSISAHANCERDLDGLENNVDSDPTMSAAAPDARTPEDFQVATANYFFMTGSGQDYVENHIADPSAFRALTQLFSGTFVSARGMHQVPVCSDVGQCAQGGVVGIFGERDLPDSSVSVEIRGVPISVPIDGGSEPVLQGFLVIAEMSDGTTRSEEYSLPSVEARQASGVPYEMPSDGTASGAQEGDACRDNDGNELQDESAPPVGGGGGGGEPIGDDGGFGWGGPGYTIYQECWRIVTRDSEGTVIGDTVQCVITRM